MKTFPCALILALLLGAGLARGADSSLIAPGAKLEKVGGGYEFTEGPAVDRDGNVFDLLFIIESKNVYGLTMRVKGAK